MTQKGRTHLVLLKILQKITNSCRAGKVKAPMSKYLKLFFHYTKETRLQHAQIPNSCFALHPRDSQQETKSACRTSNPNVGNSPVLSSTVFSFLPKLLIPSLLLLDHTEEAHGRKTPLKSSLQENQN
jgi:hypothetical protein